MNKYTSPIIYQNKHTGNKITVIGYEYVPNQPIRVYVTDTGDRLNSGTLSEHYQKITQSKE